MTVSPVFVTVLEELESTLERYPERNIYFGPRMQWAYAAFGVPSLAAQPLQWNPGVDFPPDAAPMYLQRWSDARFDTLIFFKNDFTYFSPEFLSAIATNYERDDQSTQLTVFRRIRSQ
jgi:hypothetical protein